MHHWAEMDKDQCRVETSLLICRFYENQIETRFFLWASSKICEK